MRRIILPFFLFAGSAGAVDLTATASGDLHRDDNLFLLPSTLSAVQPHGGGDSIATVALGMTALEQKGPLNAVAQITAQRVSFEHNSALNNTALDGTLAADVQGRSSSIVVQGEYAQRLASFRDVRTISRAIQRYLTVNATATQAVLGDFRVIAGLDYTRNTDSNPVIAINDYDRTGYRAGVGYYSPAGNILALEYRGIKGDGLNDNATTLNGKPLTYRANYREHSVQLHLLYAPSALVKIDTRIGHTVHDDQSGVEGSFSGLTGQLSGEWSPRATIHVTLLGSRDYQSNTGILSNGIRVGRISGTVSTDVTARLSADLTIEREWRLYRYTLDQGALRGPRSDRISSARGAVKYMANERLSLSADLSRERRQSSDLLYRYADWRVGAGISVSFGAPPQQ